MLNPVHCGSTEGHIPLITPVYLLTPTSVISQLHVTSIASNGQTITYIFTCCLEVEGIISHLRENKSVFQTPNTFWVGLDSPQGPSFVLKVNLLKLQGIGGPLLKNKNTIFSQGNAISLDRNTWKMLGLEVTWRMRNKQVRMKEEGRKTHTSWL